MMAGDIRKKGMLYHLQQRFGRKWKKVWAEAVAESTHSLSCLELFEFSRSSIKDGKKHAEGKKVIVMRDCVKITERKAEGCPKECSTFSLETTDKTHTFASPTSEIHSWITELCKLAFPLNQAECRSQKKDHHQAVNMEENTLYGTTEKVQDFLVITVATEAALRCKLYGEYILTPQSDSLLLKDCKTKQVLLTWPYRFVRKFGQDMLTFNFEAGRRCQSGEGFFEFAMSHSENLFTIISDALENYPKVEISGTRSKDQHTFHNSQKSYTPPAQAKHPKKNLTSSFSFGTNNPSDFSREENINSTSSLPSNVQDPVYAVINRPKLHSKSTKDSKNQQFGPDIETLSEDIFGVLGEKEGVNQMNPLKLAICTKCEDDEAEPVYSEVKTFEDYRRKDNVDKNEPYSLTSDLKDFQSVGFNKDPSNFQRPSKDISCIRDEDQQLDLSVEQLSIHHTPNVYGAESMYSQIPDYYDYYDDIEESVDFVQDFSYPPCPTDTHSSNFEDSQDEGFCTYDNLPPKI